MNNQQTIIKDYTNQFILKTHLFINKKVKQFDTHQKTQILVFVDEDYNIYVYNIENSQLIKSFNSSSFGLEDVKVKDVLFLTINKQQSQYENRIEDSIPFEKIVKGYNLINRNDILLITFEKTLLLYSIYQDRVVNIIKSESVDKRSFIKAGFIKNKYIVILTGDGCVVIWNIHTWSIENIITKQVCQKTITNFNTISTIKNEEFLIVSNSNGTLFLIDVSSKEFIVNKLEKDRLEHDSPVLQIEFDPNSEIVSSISKSFIYLVNIRNVSISKRIKNFEYGNSIKPNGIIPNPNFQNFPGSTYFLYGKGGSICSIDLNILLLKNKNFTSSKDVKQLITGNYSIDDMLFQFELEEGGLLSKQKKNDKQIKIYLAKSVRYISDYIVIGSNKGLIILTFNNLISQSIEINQVYSDFREKTFFFDVIRHGTKWVSYKITGNLGYLPYDSYVNDYSLNEGKGIQVKSRIITENCFDNKVNQSYLERKSILISPLTYNKESKFILICFFDIGNCVYTIYKVSSDHYISNDSNKTNALSIKSGNNCLDFTWCVYDNIYAISKKSGNNNKNNSKDSSFSVFIYKISNTFTIDLIYQIDSLVSYKIFSSHYLLGYSMMSKGKYELSFFSWIEKTVKPHTIVVNDEPASIGISENSEFMIFIYEKHYLVYRINTCMTNLQSNYNENEKHSPFLSLTHIVYIGIKSYKIIDSFVLFFISDINNGIYFHILNNNKSIPIKLLTPSEDSLLLNYRLLYKRNQKHEKERNSYTKIGFPNKILGLIGYKLAVCYSNNSIEMIEIENILIKTIAYIREGNIFSLKNSTTMLIETKYIQLYISILVYYFSYSDEVFKRIFTTKNALFQFELYSLLECFLFDYSNLSLPNEEWKVMKIMKERLIKCLTEKDYDGVLKLYSLSNMKKFSFNIDCSKVIDSSCLLSSLISNEKLFEAEVFNKNYSLGKSFDEIISVAISNLNK